MSHNLTLKDKTIAVIGLGYVGLPLAVEFGKTRQVIGFDINAERIGDLDRGIDKTREVDVADLSLATGLSFTSCEDDLANAEVYIVTAPTPIDDAKKPDLRPLERASETVGRFLSPGNVVIFESTVFPGATEEVCVPILMHQSGLSFLSNDQQDFTQGFYAGYSPERINPGDRDHRLPSIMKVTSGSTPKVAEAIDEMYREIVTAGTYLAPSIQVAEAAKVIENTQRDLNIAFVNELSMIFDLMGINTDEVLEAASTKWNFLKFKPGLVGGHCIGVDPYYLTHKASMLGHHARVITAGRSVNDEMPKYVAGKIVKQMIQQGVNLSGARVGVLGVTFKPNCPDIRNTKVFDLLKELESWGCHCLVWDPLVDAKYCENELDIVLVELDKLTALDAIIIAVSHTQILSIEDKLISSHLKSNNEKLLFKI